MVIRYIFSSTAIFLCETMKSLGTFLLGHLLTYRTECPRRQWHPTPVLLPGKSHGQRSLVAAVHGVAKSWTRLSDFTFTFHFNALEKEMATHSSVLAWRMPGTGEPGGLPFMGSHRVRHDWSDLAAAVARLIGSGTTSPPSSSTNLMNTC